MKVVIALILALALAACVTEPTQSDASREKAAQTNTALGQQYMDRGQYEVALEKLKKAIAYEESYAPAHTMLGVLYETIGEEEQAQKEYQLAVKYDPKDGDVNNNYGAFLCRSGRWEEAEPYFRTALADPFYKTPQVALSNAGGCALSAGDLDKAEKYLRQSLEHEDKLAAALLPMAQVSYRKGDYLRARAFLQRYEAVAPDTRESLLLGYRIESGLGDREMAARYRARLMEEFPESLDAEDNIGRE